MTDSRPHDSPPILVYREPLDDVPWLDCIRFVEHEDGVEIRIPPPASPARQVAVLLFAGAFGALLLSINMLRVVSTTQSVTKLVFSVALITCAFLVVSFIGVRRLARAIRFGRRGTSLVLSCRGVYLTAPLQLGAAMPSWSVDEIQNITVQDAWSMTLARYVTITILSQVKRNEVLHFHTRDRDAIDQIRSHVATFLRNAREAREMSQQSS